MRLTLALVTFLVAAPALAQPMMMDPSKMSGIPRPDSQVPPGTITVRLIRGQLTNKMVGVDVELAGPDGKAATQKTDSEGRATFGGLTGAGPFVASAKEADIKLQSQPIPLDEQMGSRVMLVFPTAGGLGAGDGVGHVDKTLPSGTIIVRAEDEGGNAVEGVDVTLAHARQGVSNVEKLEGKTDTAGEAKFSGLDHAPSSGYLAQVRANGSQFDGKPFKLDDVVGMRVVIKVRQVTADTSGLSFAEGSHLLVEINDDALQIIEVLRLHNAGTTAIDAGADGLHIPLPADAVQAQAIETPNLTIVAHEAIWRGPIAPGDTQVRLGFVLAHHNGHGEILQQTPIPFAKVAMVTQDLEGLNVSGHGLVGEQRDMQGKKLMVFFGEGTQRGGDLRLSIDGLPRSNATPRLIAAGLTIFTFLVFGVYAAGGGGAARNRLERERARLFDELSRLDAKIAKGDAGDLAAEREDKVARLADIYRGLDELGGG